MGEIVNLRREKKRRARAEAEALAAQNRALHGRTKAERDGEALVLDGALLPPDLPEDR